MSGNNTVDLSSVGCRLRAVAHVLRFVDYMHSVTDDSDLHASMNWVLSDYLYCLSDQCISSAEVVERCIQSEHQSEHQSEDFTCKV